MFRFRKAAIGIALIGLAGFSVGHAANSYVGIGRDATVKEVQAWDIDVRPDFKGLPPGSGSVAKGQEIWEGKCATCHGIFGESGEFFNPIIGGVTPKDMETGHVANLVTPGYPGRTTFMKVPTISTVWDFIRRAMPWTEPKSLSPDDVYAVLAFMLNLNGMVPDDFVLNEKTMRDVQAKLPNRNGMTTDHALWPGNEFNGAKKPDTHNVACMKDCAEQPKLTSSLPEFARNAHGNLAEQNRMVGEQFGADTTHPERALGERPQPVKLTEQEQASAAAKKILGTLQKNGCTVCHGMTNKIVGPAYSDVAKKYAGKVEYLIGKIKSGGSGIWGPIPMPAQTLSDADAKAIATWLATGGPQ